MGAFLGSVWAPFCWEVALLWEFRFLASMKYGSRGALDSFMRFPVEREKEEGRYFWHLKRLEITEDSVESLLTLYLCLSLSILVYHDQKTEGGNWMRMESEIGKQYKVGRIEIYRKRANVWMSCSMFWCLKCQQYHQYQIFNVQFLVYYMSNEDEVR